MSGRPGRRREPGQGLRRSRSPEPPHHERIRDRPLLPAPLRPNVLPPANDFRAIEQGRHELIPVSNYNEGSLGNHNSYSLYSPQGPYTGSSISTGYASQYVDLGDSHQVDFNVQRQPIIPSEQLFPYSKAVPSSSMHATGSRGRRKPAKASDKPEKDTQASEFTADEAKLFLELCIVTKSTKFEKARAFEVALGSMRKPDPLIRKVTLFKSQDWPFEEPYGTLILPNQWSYLETKLLRGIVHDLHEHPDDPRFGPKAVNIMKEGSQTIKERFPGAEHHTYTPLAIRLAIKYLDWRLHQLPVNCPQELSRWRAETRLRFNMKALYSLYEPLANISAALEKNYQFGRSETGGQVMFDRLEVETALDAKLISIRQSQPSQEMLRDMCGLIWEDFETYRIHDGSPTLAISAPISQWWTIR